MKTTAIPGVGQYHDSIRRSYATLVHVAHALEAARPHEGAGTYLRQIGRTVAAFVDRVVWADGRMVQGEYHALDALTDADAQQGGTLVDSIQAVAGDNGENKDFPEWLEACVAYDRANQTRLTGTAINALESLGLSLMASDREISDSEMRLLKEIVGGWRTAIAT